MIQSKKVYKVERRTMKKILTSVFLFVLISTSIIGVQAQEMEIRSIDVIVNEIRTDLGLGASDVIDTSLVKIDMLEELGDSVMEVYIADSKLHEKLDSYYGGDESDTLANLHIQLGVDYLNGHPITMMSFMQYGGMMNRNSGYNDSNYQSYGGMMGRNNGYNDSNYANINPTNGYYGRMTNFGSGGMTMAFLGLLALIAVLFYLFNNNNKSYVNINSNSAMNILKERYARGEITRDEFLLISSTIK